MTVVAFVSLLTVHLLCVLHRSINRAYVAHVQLEEAEADLAAYKRAQHSTQFHKVGFAAQAILDGNAEGLKSIVASRKRAFDESLEILMRDDERFDVSLASLLEVDGKMSKDEVQDMKRFLKEVREWIEPVQAHMENMVGYFSRVTIVYSRS